MYLEQIQLRNIRCFKDEVCVRLPRPANGSQNWTLILGDNGTGKSTLLRSIALGLCDETSASGLLRELSGEWVRYGEKEGRITLTLRSLDESQERFETQTIIHKTPSGNEELEQHTTPEKNFPWNKIFACGYGAAYGTLGSEVYDKYRLIDSVYSLFNYEARLQNPENALFRISRAGSDVDHLLNLINRVLMLPADAVRLDKSGLQIHAPWGRLTPAGSIGDGYAATIAWLCDLFGWTLLAKSQPFDIDLKGLVFHDEIEQHLHPLWQRKIIGLLAEEFPGLQFFATTHAPLIAIGAAGLPDDRCQLILLEAGDDAVSARTGLRPPRDLRADQVLTSYLFGLSTTSSDSLTSSIHRYDELQRKPELNSNEKAELTSLGDEIKKILGTSETKLEELARNATRVALESLAKDAIANGEVSGKALEFETARQLREIFGNAKSRK